ncbi:hypothetical protein HCN44_000583 [Aphidius gifuensis]|uniref:KIND domain-containing protein n=1 Tax=Aphidius gifuensis TaxID=684658 RepID=A0A834XNY0_APHGI|nr:hypothetical protein HCN44_000583 [Aphidius gifuensis]
MNSENCDEISVKKKLTNSQKTKHINCKLKNDTLNLEQTLKTLDGPIGQDQTWAVCHQTAKCLSKLPSNNLQELTNLNQIILHKEGHVSLDLFTDSTTTYSSEKKVVFSLGLLLYKALDFRLDLNQERCLSPGLKNLIYSMTNCDDEHEPEERLQDTDDEGIDLETEGDENIVHDNYTLKYIIKICNKRIQATDEYADIHYRSVIQAFVNEALELTEFLNKVAAERFQKNLKKLQNDTTNSRIGVSSTEHLDILNIDDWTDLRIWRAIQARFWVQVIGELHHGIKLKKVEANLLKRSLSKNKDDKFELTPYEILMNDIRERKYHLRKTPKQSHGVHKDAHDRILEFIRSRPPLKKASERKLAPKQSQLTIRELLMESIRKHKSNSDGKQKDTSYHEDSEAEINNQKKKIIPVDFRLKFGGDDDIDDDDLDDEYTVTRFEDEDEPQMSTKKSTKLHCLHDENEHNICVDDDYDDDDKSSANPWKKTGGLRLTRNEYHRFCDAQLESYDLATQCPSRRAAIRKHSNSGNIASFIPFKETPPIPRTRLQNRQRTVIGSEHSMKINFSSSNIKNKIITKDNQINCQTTTTTATTTSNDNLNDKKETTNQRPSLGDMFLDERLSLTLEEIVHIRSVLTKAELESLPVEGRVKEDVEKRRVCFLCLKTRFGFWGPWGQRCRLCERTVCVKCYSKMRIPTEQFAHVPVVLLSPALLSPSENDTNVKNTWSRNGVGGGSVGSAPASPAYRRREHGLNNSTPSSSPNHCTPSGSLTTGTTPIYHEQKDDTYFDKNKIYSKINKSPNRMTSSVIGNLSSGCNEQRVSSEHIRGVSMVVCYDCRIMVKQIIKSSRSTRQIIRNNVISRLTLNLSPAYV